MPKEATRRSPKDFSEFNGWVWWLQHFLRELPSPPVPTPCCTALLEAHCKSFISSSVPSFVGPHSFKVYEKLGYNGRDICEAFQEHRQQSVVILSPMCVLFPVQGKQPSFLIFL